MNNIPKTRPIAGIGKHLTSWSFATAVFISLLTNPLIAVEATTGIKGSKASVDKKQQKLLVSGKTTGSAPHTAVSVFDAADHRLLYTGQTNAKSAFKFTFDLDTIPCMMQVESGDASVAVKVAGADKGCKTTPRPVCNIQGSNRALTETSGQQSFSIISKTKNLSFDWDFGDGEQTQNTSNPTHTFSHQGLYQVSAIGKDANGNQCSDAIMVSVAPPAGSNPYGAVAESGTRPKKAAGMPGANGENDESALVAFPFEDMGMEGGRSAFLSIH